MGANTYSLYSNAQIKQLEQLAAQQHDITEYELMQRAGAAAYDILKRAWREAETVTVCCGTGNNGGDGFVLAKLAKDDGKSLNIWYLGDLECLSEAAQDALQACRAVGIEPQPYNKESITGDVLVDGLLGTGLNAPLQDDWAHLVQAMNDHDAPILALDVPSGIHGDTGAVMGCAIKADVTVTFIGMKQGLVTGAAADLCGEIRCDDLGIPEEAFYDVVPQGEIMELAACQRPLKARHAHAHKGDFGHVLVIGGDYGMPGSVRMAGEAAMRVGAGLVSVATRPEHMAVISGTRPELMFTEVQAREDLNDLLAKVDLVLIGPGLGHSSWSHSLMETVLQCRKPLIVDADGLNSLAKMQLSLQRNNWVLTPHVGEAARLLDVSTQEILMDRYSACRKIQKRYGGVCVLKGAGTIITADATAAQVCIGGNPGMATAGCGDVLAGVIAGLVAQGLTTLDAAKLGVVVHAYAGDRAAAAGERGLMAMDLMPHLRKLVNAC